MEPIDTITLKDACETPLWKMVWAGEPNRRIAVYMTYDDLMRLCDVDFVQVVRCKDCEFNDDGYRCPFREAGWGYAPDRYCSFGERKEANDD